MNLKEARDQGYKEGRVSWTQGYTTRKFRSEEKIKVKMSRFGELYYLIPSWRSTRFCKRQYLVKEEI
jgi:hypothetical protein